MTRETYRTNIQKSNHIIRPLELLKNIMKNRVEIITKKKKKKMKRKKRKERSVSLEIVEFPLREKIK